MSLVDHLNALRTHLLRGGIWFVAAFMICVLFASDITAIVTLPHRNTMHALGLSDVLSTFAYQENFIVDLKLALFGGLFLGMPMLLRELWRFIAVGLYPTERRHIAIITPLISVCFFIGTLFGYFVLVPLGLRFLASYSDRTVVVTQIRLTDYVSLFLTLTLTLGLVFELPLVMWSLAKLGLVSAANFVRGRRYAILGAFLLGALLTPPDVITQTLLAVPLCLLYELGILLAGGWRSTLGGGRVLLLGIPLVIGAVALVGYDLYRVDLYLGRVGADGSELTWEGGSDRPYRSTLTGASAKLLAIAERGARPAAARAEERPELVPLAVTLAAAAPPLEELRAFLRTHADDERGFVRDRVACALGALADPADSELLERLRTDPDGAVQASAAEALLVRGLPSGAFTLIRLLEAGSGDLAAQARKALVTARGSDAGSAEDWWQWYYGALTKRPLGDHLAQVEILAALIEQGAAADLETELARFLEDEEPYVRSRAAELAPATMLHRLADDPDPTVRLAAGLSLIKLQDPLGLSLLAGLVGERPRPVSRRAYLALRETTGADLPEERHAWEQWWQEQGASFNWR